MKKLLSLLLCVFLLLGMVACTPPAQPPEQPEKTYEEQKALYGDVISRYTALLTAKHNGEELSAPDTTNMNTRESAIAETLYGIVNACKDAQAAENLGYGYQDADGNGTPELFLLTKYNTIKAIFTLSENTPILLESYYGSAYGSFLFADKNRFLLTRVNDSLSEGIHYICHVDGDKMTYDAIYGKTYDQDSGVLLETFQMQDGVRVPLDEDTYQMLNKEYQSAQVNISIPIFKISAPLIHYPLAQDIADEDLPAADFSDYAAICKTYLAISKCLTDFNSMKWQQGEYDHLFSFPNDRSYEYYNRLLNASHHNVGRIGYDEIDLNGDGQNELVLLNENYNIKAIFTMKNGVPVLLFSAFEYETCWLDAEGLIHVDRTDYYELEFSLYEFKENGEYALRYAIFKNKNGYYLTKDGKEEILDYDTAMEVYGNYVCYTEPFDPNEHTRNVSALTYTPIEEAADVITNASSLSWYRYASLEITTGKDLASGTSYLSFENVTDTQMKVNVKYVFTYFYPDPERENYMIPSETESSLIFTLRKENGNFVFDENGVKGRIEFGQKNIWLIIEESTDERFPVGHHCYEEKQ